MVEAEVQLKVPWVVGPGVMEAEVQLKVPWVRLGVMEAEAYLKVPWVRLGVMESEAWEAEVQLKVPWVRLGVMESEEACRCLHRHVIYQVPPMKFITKYRQIQKKKNNGMQQPLHIIENVAFIKNTFDAFVK